MSDIRRYPGLLPFKESEIALFCGRETETNLIVQMLGLDNLVVLHGQSGAGKTSLVNAGIEPKLKEDSKVHYKVIRIRFHKFYQKKLEENIHLTKEGYLNDPIDIFRSAIGLQNRTEYLDEWLLGEDNLWLSLKQLELDLLDSENKPIRFLLIFDQFEEIFTYPVAQVQAFTKELSKLYHQEAPDAVREGIDIKRITEGKSENDEKFKKVQQVILNDLDIKILISMRSDKLHYLEHMNVFLPELMISSYELKGFDDEQARKVIVDPAFLEASKGQKYYTKPFIYQKEALELLIFNLKEGLAKTEEEKNENHFSSFTHEKRIDPFILQMVCYYLEEEVKKNDLQEITPEQVTKKKLHYYFRKYYENRINELGDYKHPPDGQKNEQSDDSQSGKKDQQNRISKWISDWRKKRRIERRRGRAKKMVEDALILPVGLSAERVMVDERSLLKELEASAPQRRKQKEVQDEREAILNDLVDARLIRAITINNSGNTSTSYKIVHDALVEPILESKKAREKKQWFWKQFRKEIKSALRWIIPVLLLLLGAVFCGGVQFGKMTKKRPCTTQPWPVWPTPSQKYTVFVDTTSDSKHKLGFIDLANDLMSIKDSLKLTDTLTKVVNLVLVPLDTIGEDPESGDPPASTPLAQTVEINLGRLEVPLNVGNRDSSDILPRSIPKITPNGDIITYVITGEIVPPLLSLDRFGENDTINIDSFVFSPRLDPLLASFFQYKDINIAPFIRINGLALDIDSLEINVPIAGRDTNFIDIDDRLPDGNVEIDLGDVSWQRTKSPIALADNQRYYRFRGGFNFREYANLRGWVKINITDIEPEKEVQKIILPIPVPLNYDTIGTLIMKDNSEYGVTSPLLTPVNTTEEEMAGYYVVVGKGTGTLHKIAKGNANIIAEIKRINGLKSNTIKKGQVLKLPTVKW